MHNKRKITATETSRIILLFTGISWRGRLNNLTWLNLDSFELIPGCFMGFDMRDRVLEETSFGVIALRKLGEVAENFRIYEAGRVPEPPKDWTHFVVTGADFTDSLAGPQKGQLNIMIPGTKRNRYGAPTSSQTHVFKAKNGGEFNATEVAWKGKNTSIYMYERLGRLDESHVLITDNEDLQAELDSKRDRRSSESQKF